MLARRGRQLFQADGAEREVGQGRGPSRRGDRTAWLWGSLMEQGPGRGWTWESKQSRAEATALTCSPGCPAGPG